MSEDEGEKGKDQLKFTDGFIRYTCLFMVFKHRGFASRVYVYMCASRTPRRISRRALLELSISGNHLGFTGGLNSATKRISMFASAYIRQLDCVLIFAERNLSK